MDMAAAFLEHLIGPEATRTILSIVEFTPKEEGNDEFADVHGLVEA